MNKINGGKWVNKWNVKKIENRWGKCGLFLALFLISIMGISYVCTIKVYAETGTEVNVLFLNDLHSHLDSYEAEIDGQEVTVGGVARIKTMIDEKKEEDPETLVLDGGDFSMGTMYQTIYQEDACELRMLGLIGVDVTTTGNHEFDYRAQGYYDMLEAAVDSGDPLPQFVLCNVDWDNMEMTEDQKLYQQAFSDYGVKDYTVFEKNGVKIAVFGLFGDDAQDCAPTCALTFKDRIEAAQETVAEIEENENPDMIIALSHSGADLGEDEELAKKVDGIDLIVSGHSHILLTEPDVIENTSIVADGCYGEYLGSLTMEAVGDGTWQVENYATELVSDDIPENQEIKDKLEAFKQDINKKYLSQYDYTEDEVLAYNPYEFSSVDDLSAIHTEHNLGDIIADSYVYAAEQADSMEDVVDVSVVPSGTIRGTYLPGNITVEDAFDSLSLGIGADGKPGYPLISVYLTGKELKAVCEVDASISDSMTTAKLYMSGLEFTFNPNRTIFNKVTEAHLYTEDGTQEELENDKLYHVVADLYSGQMLGAVTQKSFGILSIVPKNADGNPIENYEDCIIYDGGQEVKAWTAIASYLASFESNDEGISQVPVMYQGNQGRKNVDDSTDLKSLCENPSQFTMLFLVICSMILLGVTGIIIFLVKRSKRRKQQEK